GAQTEADPDHYATSTRVRRDAKSFLPAAFSQSEHRHHVIGNQRGPRRFGNFAQVFQVARLWQVQASVTGNRLDDYPRDLLFIGRERGFDRVDVIERQYNRMLSERSRHPGAVRISERQCPRARFDEQRIGMPMIAAIELDDLIALRVAPR